MIGKYARIFFLLFLFISLVALILAIWGTPYIVNRQIHKSVQIENGSLMFKNWQKMPMPLSFGIYVFNVTNPAEVSEGAKPKLQQIGPYVYKQYREKTILEFGANDTVKYTLKKTFFFDQEKSGELTQDDEVTVINFSYMAAILSVNELMPSFVGMVNGALEQFFGNLTDPFLRVKVKDLFFDGIYLNCNGDHSALGLVCGQIRAQTPPTMRPAEDGSGFYFSMFSHLNRTETGPYEVVRGTQNINELGHIVAYKGKRFMNNWGDKYCGMINGSDSSIFPPNDPKNIPQKLYSFEPDLCRSLYASLVGPSTVFNISAYHYEVTEQALASKSANPSNKCYCKHNWSGSHDGCLLMGVLNLAPCQGAPAIASLPHFYLASEELLEYFDGGIAPEKEKHNTYAYLDSVTGVVLKGMRRMQFNIELRNMPAAPQLAKVSTGLFPLLWIEEGAEIPESIQEELRSSHRLLDHLYLAPYVVLGLSLLGVIVSAVAVIRSGALPFCARATNSVSFILRPATADPNKHY